MVINKTNATKITQIAGSPETDEWAGVKIRLYATETEFAGETVECLRVKAAPVNGTKPTPKPVVSEMVDDSDIPFAWLMPLIIAGSLAASLLV